MARRIRPAVAAVGADDPARRARELARAAVAAALATRRATDGAPVATWVAVAWDLDATPLFLLSTLADHTKNLAADPRASLLIVASDEGGQAANPQRLARVTLTGTIAPDSRPRARARYLACHPAARAWAGFADFAMFRMAVAEARLVGGFADAHRVPGRRFRLGARAVGRLARAESDLLGRLDADGPALARLARAAGRGLAGGAGQGWRAMAIDPEGCLIVCGPARARVALAESLFEPEAWLSALRARARAG